MSENTIAVQIDGKIVSRIPAHSNEDKGETLGRAFWDLCRNGKIKREQIKGSVLIPGRLVNFLTAIPAIMHTMSQISDENGDHFEATCGICWLNFHSGSAFVNHLREHETKKETTPEPKCDTICPPPKPPSILLEAEELIHGERRKEYGPVSKSLNDAAKMWSVVLGVEVNARQVCLCMASYKIARDSFASKRDNRTDACGYLALAQQIEDEGEGKA